MITIKRIVLSLAAFLAGLLAGRADRAPEHVRKVLVIQMSKLGDMVCTTPVFSAFKEAHPRAQLFVMGNRLNKDLLEGNPHVDNYIVFEGVYSALLRLRREHFDAVLIAGAPDLTSLVISCLARIPLVVAPRIEGGDSPFQDIWYKLVLRQVVIVPIRMGHYTPGEYLHLLRPLGIQVGDTTKHLAFSPQAEARARTLFAGSGRPLVGVAPAAGDKAKQWPSEHFAAAAEQLAAEEGATVVVFGSPVDREEVENMFKALKHPERVLNLANKLSIDELKASIAQLDLFVSADTGPIYIAEAFGISTVDIVGPVDEREQPPRGDKHAVVTPPGKREPALRVMNTRDYDYTEARRQAESITVDSVVRACKALLSKA
jgi:heptosyltransferase-2